MQVIFKTGTIKNIAALLLSVWLFAFVHSELDQFAMRGDTHEAHDFCKLVNNTASHSDLAGSNLCVTQNIFIALIPADSITNRFCLTGPNHSGRIEIFIPPDPVNIYILNGSFLI